MKMISKEIILILVLFFFHTEGEDCPHIVPRGGWATIPPKSINYLIVPIPYVIIHHSVTPECTTRSGCVNRLENIRDYHMTDLKSNDIGFNFMIGGDGNIYEGCGWTLEGAHTYGFNKRSISIMFVGNFQEKKVNSTFLDLAHKLILCGKDQGMLREDVKVIGGRQAISTASPGLELFLQIQDWPEWAQNP
ncbi:peptidoglycan-recognition protein SA-like isoform X2 [Prorops nasuta]|uniref:peptidoglycan-recognition protein SA-like isoform X2 n=1 Tax=Prorops nasuta TaxID=863751 RepID=UPI0034CE93D6